MDSSPLVPWVCGVVVCVSGVLSSMLPSLDSFSLPFSRVSIKLLRHKSSCDPAFSVAFAVCSVKFECVNQCLGIQKAAQKANTM